MDNSNQTTPQEGKSINFLLITLFLVVILVIAGGAYFLLFAKGTETQNQQSTNLTPTGPTSTPVPTSSVPSPLAPPQFYWQDTGNIPIKFSQAIFNTNDPKNGTQTVTVTVNDSAGNITSVNANVQTDKLSKSYPLSLSSSSGSRSVWSGSWVIGDTYNYKFRVTFTAKDNKGNTTSVDAGFR